MGEELLQEHGDLNSGYPTETPPHKTIASMIQHRRGWGTQAPLPSITGFRQVESCAGDLSWYTPKSTVAILWLEINIQRHSSIFLLNVYPFCLLFYDVHRVQEEEVLASYISRHLFSAFDQLWLSTVMATDHDKRKLLWPNLMVTLLYGHCYFDRI